MIYLRIYLSFWGKVVAWRTTAVIASRNGEGGVVLVFPEEPRAVSSSCMPEGRGTKVILCALMATS